MEVDSYDRVESSRRTVTALFKASCFDEPISPERRLLLAIIHQSIWDLVAPAPQVRAGRAINRQLSHSRRVSLEEWRTNRLEAARWLLQDDPITHARRRRASRRLSLHWCCQEIGIPTEKIRHRVKVTLGLAHDSNVRPYTKETLSLCL